MYCLHFTQHLVHPSSCLKILQVRPLHLISNGENPQGTLDLVVLNPLIQMKSFFNKHCAHKSMKKHCEYRGGVGAEGSNLASHLKSLTEFYSLWVHIVVKVPDSSTVTRGSKHWTCCDVIQS